MTHSVYVIHNLPLELFLCAFPPRRILSILIQLIVTAFLYYCVKSTFFNLIM